jgi:hypothetical protein
MNPTKAVALGLALLCPVMTAHAAPAAQVGAAQFVVSFDESVRTTPVSGRLVVYLIAPGSSIDSRSQPGDAPFFEDPQPCAGINVTNLAPGTAVTVDDAATAYPDKLSKLPAGIYRVQAVLDQARDNSDWKRENGNLFSKAATIEINPELRSQIELKLTQITRPKPALPSQGGIAQVFEVRSELLSKFHGRDVFLKAGVVKPIDWKEGRSYAAVYEIPGYGGDSRTALMMARGRTPERIAAMPQVEHELWSSAFRIVLDPESGNGHTLFADSDNNGPWARALVEELIPALEARFGLIKSAEARLITGHSSGGWSSLWLQVTHPETFGGAWPSSPDPVDFRAFQRTNIYEDASMYLDTRGEDPTKWTPSFTTLAGETTMTVRTENQVEEVIGPRNTSGQQWDSWLATFGPKAADGLPADLYDPVTGAIDQKVSESFRRYDIGEMLRKDPERIGRIFREKVHLIVGDRDNYGLNLAVSLLKEDLDKLSPAKEGDPGSIKILPGDHGTVMMNPEARDARSEMLECLKASGVLAK